VSRYFDELSLQNRQAGCQFNANDCLVTPSPFVPLPLDKGKGVLIYKRGKASLGLFSLWFNNAGVFKRGDSPSFQIFPFPY